MDNNTVYLNGQYLPLSEAKISVMDRGFLFGDAIYEVIPSYSGKLFHFRRHIERLENSLSSIRLENPYSREQWQEILTSLLDGSQDQSVYVQVTRGVAGKRDHAFPEHAVPTVFAMASPIVPFSNLEAGVKAMSIEDSRWQLCNVKATALLANILLRQQAIEQGCVEAILVRDGYVTEGAASNIFAIIDGVLITPPKGHEILPGVTRDVILELARENDIPCSEDIISLDALQMADEIWLTSSTREIVPVVQLDGTTVANGKPGPIWHTMNQLFQAYKRSCHE